MKLSTKAPGVDEVRSEVVNEVPDEEVQKAELLKSLVVLSIFGQLFVGLLSIFCRFSSSLVNLLSIFVEFSQSSVDFSFILVFVGHFIQSTRGAYHFGFDRRLFACFSGFLGFLVHFWVHF